MTPEEIVETAQIARGLSCEIRIELPGGTEGKAVMHTIWHPCEPPRLKGKGFERYRRAQARAIDRANATAGREVEIVVV